jgi:SAM-dependent methyltransferase
VSVSFDRAADYYDDTRGLPTAVMAHVVRILADRLHGRVIEIGAGTGRFARPLQEAGIDVVPVDIARAMLERGRSQGLRAAVRADAVRLPFRDGAFTGALTANTLGKIPDWAGALLEARRTAGDSLTTVLERSEGFDPLEEYAAEARRLGHAIPRENGAETHLARHLPTRERVAVDTVTGTFTGDAMVDRLRGRMFSDTWEVPATIHDRVVEVFAERYSGRTVQGRTVVEVVTWDLGAWEPPDR